MKELALPHNDWWMPHRKLDLGGRTPDENLSEIMESLVPATELAKAVVLGLKKLESSPSIQSLKSQRNFQERLRPLFCPVEVNLASDLSPNAAQKAVVQIDSSFFVDPRLATLSQVPVSRQAYQATHQKLGSRFPETGLMDADHAALVPVKAHSDFRQIQELIDQKIIDSEFVSDVLAVDLTQPQFSVQRCELLRLVPTQFHLGWKNEFVRNLKAISQQSSIYTAAQLLVENFTNPVMSQTFHLKRARTFLNQCRNKWSHASDLTPLVKLINQRRLEVAANEISRNPRGQILEPGFRVIFPMIANPSKPGQLALNDSCEVVDIGTASGLKD